VQDQTSNPVCKFVRREHSIYNIPATHTKLAGKSQLSFLGSAEKDAPDPESCEDVLQRTGENTIQGFALGGFFKFNNSKMNY
jgi:hypothetical protein